MHLYSSKAFQRYKERGMKHCGLKDPNMTKQNKLPRFIDRLMWLVPLAQVLPCFQLIFPSKSLVFWTLFEFSTAEITLKSISRTSESKSDQINFH